MRLPEATCDAANKPTRNTDRATAQRILAAIDGLNKRCDAVETRLTNVPTRGPAEPLTPRVMSPAESYTAAQQAYIASQAKYNQHRAATAMPNVYPDHPEFAAKKRREQEEAIREQPHHSDTPTATGDHALSGQFSRQRREARAIARHQQHLQFFPEKNLNSKQKIDACIYAKAMRVQEAEAMASMVKQIHDKIGD